MSEEIFRKKSLDRIKSPENLDDYIRVSNPALWLLLASVIVLLVGAVVWSMFGKVETTLAVGVNVEDGRSVCISDDDNADVLVPGVVVRFEGYEGVIESVAPLEDHGIACVLRTDTVPEHGIYMGEAVISSENPISFILN